jgi:arginine decarboxylase
MARNRAASTATVSAPAARPPSERRSNGESIPWSIEKSVQLYQVEGWGHPYFMINDQGHVEVHPRPDLDRGVDLFDLANELTDRGIALPILLRFPQIVGHRIKAINEAFRRAIEEYEYDGVYRGVYPVKVNPQHRLVAEVIEQGRPYQFGLEVGSKPELLIALAAMREPGSLVICNGYKDATYIETALIAQRFDRTVIIVLERLQELKLVLEAAKRLGITPAIGVRAKLASKGMGRWAESAGDRAKFGLTSAEIVELVDRLRDADLLECLQLLHFHIGSQISSIIPIKHALQEAASVYVELAKMGCKMGYIDVGGGLAIDYDGSKTDFHASRNYTLAEYAADVVSTLGGACNKASMKPPTIVSESGRAVVAHHSILIFDVVGANETRFGEPAEPPQDSHRVLRELYETYKNVKPKNVQESWHDVSQAKEEAQSLFKYGYFSLRERAQADRLYWHCCEKIQQTLRRLRHVPEELTVIEKVMSTIYYCNFSVFQSAPDSWAIDQLFPIMPLHRLDEEPTTHAALADLTCDSDGMIDHFIDVEDVKATLDVHAYDPLKPYYLGMFLNGAYQEILGDLHNLFGDTNAVHVEVHEGGYRVRNVVKGDSMTDVLKYVGHAPDRMIESVREQAEEALAQGRITIQQMRLLMRHYERALDSYTYLTGDAVDPPGPVTGG